MEWWIYLLIAIGVCLLGIIAVVLIRTAMFKPKKHNYVKNTEEIVFDKQKNVSNLQELIRCKTVSFRDTSLEDDKEFEKLVNLLPKLYPNVYKACTLQKFDGRALLFKWEGKSHEKPTVLMAHYDVVPVDEQEWSKPAFDAIIENGELWGRGAVDTKVTFNAALFAADTLISQGFVPNSDIYLAFSGGEEVNNDGALNIVKYFEENNIELGMVLDEGGAVVQKVFPGVDEKCAVVGIAEKGLLNLKYTVKSAGGHASAPKKNTPIPTLSNACIRIEKHPFKMHLSKATLELLDEIGRYSKVWALRMVLANLWLFKPLLGLAGKLIGGEINALLRTTVAFTQFKGSNTENVIPPEATMVSNIRINLDESIDSTIAYLTKTINNDNIELSVINGSNPSVVSQSSGEAWDKIGAAIVSTWDGSVVIPYVMLACSDSRHYGRISDKVYRFSACDLTNQERAGIHGNDERIRLEVVERATSFYIRLIKSC